MKKLLLIAITAAMLTACGKSEKEIELERAKIELQREQIRLEEKKQAEAKAQQETTQPMAQATYIPPQQQENNTQQTQKRQEFVRHEEGILVNNAKATMRVNLLRSLQTNYKENNSILCGEFMDDSSNSFKRFVFVETFNEQDGTWKRSIHQDWNYSPSFTDDIWRSFCRN